MRRNRRGGATAGGHRGTQARHPNTFLIMIRTRTDGRRTHPYMVVVT